MSKMLGAKCKLCRRAQEKLFLKGDKCLSAKCLQTRRPFIPGHHGPTHRGRLSDYALRLREKQKARQIYGLTERQFENCFERARRVKGVTGSNLLFILERRLDNVAYRLGFSSSRRGSKQLVKHGHVLVNGKKVDVPSFMVRTGDMVAVSEKAKPRISKQAEVTTERKSPDWLELSGDKLSGKVARLPERDDIDTLLEEQLIVEYYSR